jgi:hypothetical protein
MLHELVSKMDSQALDMTRQAAAMETQRVEMERQAKEIALLKQKLAEESPTNDGSLARRAEQSLEDVDFEDDEAVAARACDRETTVSCRVNQRKGGRRAEMRARNV